MRPSFFSTALSIILPVCFASAAFAQDEPTCDDLAGIDFGDCEMILGVGIIDGACTLISGCESPVPLFPTQEACEAACAPTCDDLSGIDFGPCDAVLGFGVISRECQEISGCESPVPLFPTHEACIVACGAIPTIEHSWGLIKTRFE